MRMPSYIQKIYSSILTQYFRYVLVAVAILVAALGYLVLIQPQFENVRLVGVLALKNESEKLSDRQAYLARVTDMVERYRAAVSSQTVKAENMLPVGFDNAALFRTMQAIANQSGVMLQSVVLNKTSLGGSGTGTSASGTAGTADVLSEINKKLGSSGTMIKSSTVSVTLAGDGTYETFKKMLSTIELSVRLFDLGSISYTSVSAAQPTGSIEQAQALTNYSFELKTYYLEPTSAQTK